MAINQEAITFYVGIEGLNTSVQYVYTLEEWHDTDLPANVQWECVTVANEADKAAYIEAYNRYLCAAWTPNQTRDDREENAMVETQQLEIMRSLEMASSEIGAH